MGDTQNTVVDDLASSAPVDNGPLNAHEADERLTALLGGNPEPDNADEEAGNSEAATDETQTDDNPDEELDPSALAEDEETAPNEEEDAPGDYSSGRFAADDAKVTLEDGSVVSIADLKRGHLFQRDYTQKTTALAEERKAIEASKAEYNQAQESLKAEREWALWAIQNYAPQQPQRPDVSPDVDPFAWIKYQADTEAYNLAVTAYHQMNSGKAVESEKMTKEQEAQNQKRLSTEVAELHRYYPALKDPAKAKSWFDDTFSVVSEAYGLEMDMLKSIPDHRFIRVLRDAALYQRAKNKAPDVKKEVQRKPPVAQGSGPRHSPEAQARKESETLKKSLRETGSAAAADAYLARLLG